MNLCGECKGEGTVHSGVMLIHAPPVASTPVASMARHVGAIPTPKAIPILLVHPTIARRIKGLVDRKDLGPKDRLVASMIKAGEITIEVSDKVPLRVPCKACC